MSNAFNVRLGGRVRTILRGTTVLLAASCGAHALAADADSDALQEITVTAERRVENVRDVPISLTVFNAEAITEQNFQGVESYFSQTPNVSFTSEGTRDRKQLSLRGISDQLSPDNNIKEGSFGFYIDEFNVAQGTSNPEIVDIDRIEILRGPQGTYFGRNAVGGAINITTKQPTNEFFAEASAQYSSFNTVDSHIILNLPLIDNILAVRIVGRDETSDGNIKNINAIGGGNDSKYTYGKIIVRYTPTEQLTIDTTATASKERVGMRNGVPSGVLGDFSASALYSGPPYNGVAIPDGVGFYPVNTSNVNFNRPQDDGTTLDYVSNRVKYTGDAFTVTNVLGYLYSNEFEGGDIDGSSLDLFYETASIKRSSLSEELRVASTPGHAIDWTGGFYYGHDIGHATQYTYTGADNPFGLPNGYQVTSSLSDSSDLSYAVFGEGVWHIDPALSLTVGARYTRETVYNDGYNTSGALVENFVNGKATFNNFSPRVSLLYLATEQVNLYATISRGFKAGGVQINPNLDDPSYKPETLTNYEIGFKTQAFDRRLILNVAAFYMDWKNLQTEFAQSRVIDNEISFFTGIENAASARSYGVELDATAKATDHLTFGAGVGYLNAKFRSYDNAFINGNLTDLSGFQMPNSPKWTLNASTEYTFEPVAGFESYVRAEWVYRSGIYSDKTGLVLNIWPYKVPGFNQTNLRVGFTKDRFDFQAYAENAFKNKYFTNAYEKAFAGGLYVQPSVRRLGIRATVHY